MMKNAISCVVGLLPCVLTACVLAQDARIEVQPGEVVGEVSPYLTGACLEDVNHEVYGGLYSQMIFGESFQEPAPPVPLRGFTAYGGDWRVSNGELLGPGGDGPKLVSDHAPFADGEVSVEVFFPDRAAGNAGLIVRVNDAGRGADAFDGYEVSLDPAAQVLRLGRHLHNWQLIRDTPCAIPVSQWLPLTVRTRADTIEARLDGRTIIRHTDPDRRLHQGTVGLRQWGRDARYRRLCIRTDDASGAVPFEAATGPGADVSGMWRGFHAGTASGEFALVTNQPFAGRQSQRVSFLAGDGEVGVENQGLNRWGLHVVGGRPYEGHVWARATKPVEAFVALETGDGSRIAAEKRIRVSSPEFQRVDFTLRPDRSIEHGRLAIKLKRPGTVELGYAFLQPGAWGRFQGLPVRRDVAEGLQAQGITVLRYGGSMINHPQYRWKKMIGPRDRRPPCEGTWYPHSSNGWGIPDFLNFCEQAGFLAVPALNVNESPPDIADFIEYVNGSPQSAWGRRRAADGHPAPYRLKHLELGNEERVDNAYWSRFKPIAEAVWAKDPRLILVVGDFAYGRPIRDPFHFTGAASGITTLAAHQQILSLARQHRREVWFDVHIGTEGPGPSADLQALPSYVDALDQVAAGALHRTVVFEFNAGNHQHRRALANASAILATEGMAGRIPIATSANCLQPDGQNDNGWDQGLLFLNPSTIWLQPPGYVTQMIARNHQPLLVRTRLHNTDPGFEAVALRSRDGRTVVLQVVNLGDQPVSAGIRIEGFHASKRVARVEELAGALETVNTATEPRRLQPTRVPWRYESLNGGPPWRFAAHSFTVLRFE